MVRQNLALVILMASGVAAVESPANAQKYEKLKSDKKAALADGIKAFIKVDKLKKPLFNCHTDKATCSKVEICIETVTRYAVTHAVYSKDPHYELSAYGVLYDKFAPMEKSQYRDAVKEYIAADTATANELKKQVTAFCNACKY